MTEAEMLFDKYFYKSNPQLRVFENTKQVTDFTRVLSSGNISFQDAPDVVLWDEEMVYIIEHFEFDCYPHDRKGSQYRKEKSRIDREIRKLNSSKEIGDYRDRIKGIPSYASYIKNITEAFKNHYQKISQYKANVLKGALAGKKSKVIFLIEDVSPLGTLVFSRTEEDYEGPVFLANSKDFLDLLSNSPDVDGVVACSSISETRHMWFIDCAHLEENYKNLKNYSELVFFDAEVQISAF